MPELRLLIADDHPVFRHGIRTLIEARPGLRVVGEATTGPEAVQLAQALQPDVVLMDVRMPGLNGVEATRAIVQANPGIRVLMVTMFEDDASVFSAMRAGARGYILKDADKAEVLRAVEAIGNGEAIFAPSIATRLIAFFAAPPPSLNKDVFPDLTEREREILHLIATGATNAEIAGRLALSQKTVANYVSNILGKLQVSDRAHAVIRARDAGLGST